MSGRYVSLQGKTAVRLYSHLVFVSFLCLGLGLTAARPTQGQVTETIVHTFNTYGDGANPETSLIQGQDGNYYGTTVYGGTNGYGTLFKITPTGTLTTLHSFAGPAGLDGYFPFGKLVQGSDGTLYGTTEYASTASGLVYKVNPDGTGFTVLHNFNGYAGDGANLVAGVILGSDGMLYGGTLYGGAYGYGTVFQLSKDGAVYNILHSFNDSDGYFIQGGVIQGRDGMLYGTSLYGGTDDYGTVFQLSTDGTVFNSLHSFGADGLYYPQSGLIQANDGNLYGTTFSGGSNSAGTVYQISTDGTVFNQVHGFNYSDGGFLYAGVIQGNDGMLYGTTYYGGSIGYGTVFQVSTDGTTFNSLHSFNPNTEGYYPYAGVIQGSDGLLHGVTYDGPGNLPRNIGTIYTLDTASTTFTTVLAFSNGFADGANPNFGRLVLGKDGNFYGTTLADGVYGNGALYKITPAGKVTILHLFTGPDGIYPYNNIAFDSKGNIYGATLYSGAYGVGTVFKYTPSTNTFTTLFSFGQSGGAYPASGVVISGTKLVGTTLYGGQYGQGIVYQISLPTATTPLTFHVLHSFSGPEGANPFGTPILGSDKSYYGTTQGGGANGYGTVFKIVSSGVLTTLHSFNYGDGAYPYAGLVQGRDGMLYGTTPYGGYGAGTVYQISKSGVFNTLHDFAADGSDGGNPTDTLMQASDGLLYGTAEYGNAIGLGTAFKISTDGSVFSILHSFTSGGTDGAYPIAGLVEGSDGNLYGTTYGGGIYPDNGGNSPDSNIDISGTVYRLKTLLPLIKSFSPTSGSASGGTTVTVKGVNLIAPAVYMDGVAQTVLAGGTTTIFKFKLNSTTPVGSWPIIVGTPNGSVTTTKLFTVGPEGPNPRPSFLRA